MNEETQKPAALIEAEQQDAIDRARRVSHLLKKSACIWLEVAREVNDAKVSLTPFGFKLFLEKASLTQSIADKMPRIAEASILYLDESKTHLEKLEGWTTLYEVAKLPEKNVREMYRELERNPDQALTRSFIQQFKPPKATSPKAPISVATITLIEEDLKRIDYNEILKFSDDLAAIQRIIDQSIIAAGITLNTKALERVQTLVMNSNSEEAEFQTHFESEDNSAEERSDPKIITLFPLQTANSNCSDISSSH